MTNTAKTVPALTFVLLVGKDAIEAACISIQKRGKKLDYDIQLAALSAMQHHSDHGDTSLINRVVECMPKGSRVNALRDFIQTVGGVTFNEKTNLFDHEKGKPFDLAAGCAQMWTDFKPEAPYVPFDAAKAIAALLKKVDAADASKGDKVTPEQAAAIRTLAAQMCGV